MPQREKYLPVSAVKFAVAVKEGGADPANNSKSA